LLKDNKSLNKEIMKWLLTSCQLLMVIVSAVPYRECPTWMRTNGFINEMGMLADAVSWANDGSIIEGVCGNYTIVQDISGKYDTRMRIYQSLNYNLTVLSFRPTQSTPDGQNIHNNRKMTKCSFFPKCQGKVHDRFQEAFLSLITQIKDWGFIYNDVATVGHSLGGSLQLFMGIYLWKKYNKPPILSLGFAGPFIGDQQFSDIYLDGYFYVMNHNWWQIETVDMNNPNRYDGTTEGYQVNNNEIFIDMDAVCSFPINPLSIPDQAYGMHDLRQYLLYTTGRQC